MDIIKKPVNFLKEVKVELGKVSWSTPRELMSSTVVVITTTVIATVFIGIVDVLLSKIVSLVFK